MNAKSAAHYRILVIEDDPRMVELLHAGLGERGHTVVTAANADEGERMAMSAAFDAIVLDLGLPGRSGCTLRLRAVPTRPAIVMLNALNQEDNVVYGPDAGADGSKTKPFSLRELLARITSAVRRNRTAAEGDPLMGPFRLDIRKRVLLCKGKPVDITRSEYLLLRALSMNRGEVLQRRQLMQAVWGSSSVTSGTLDALVNTLRDKLDGEQPGLIITVRGVGYLLDQEADRPRNAFRQTPAKAIR